MAEITMRERKKETTKTKIQEAAIELINKYGFAETTMQHIADKADVALRTLYNYFPSKESIVATYIRGVVKAMEQAHLDEMMGLDTTHERLIFVCRKISDWSQHNRILSEVYASDPRNYFYANTEGIPQSGIEDVVVIVMQDGQKMGDITEKIPIEVLVRQFMAVFYFSVITWLRDSEQELFNIFKEGIDILYQGIKKNGVETAAIFYGMFC